MPICFRVFKHMLTCISHWHSLSNIFLETSLISLNPIYLQSVWYSSGSPQWRNLFLSVQLFITNKVWQIQGNINLSLLQLTPRSAATSHPEERTDWHRLGHRASKGSSGHPGPTTKEPRSGPKHFETYFKPKTPDFLPVNLLCRV